MKVALVHDYLIRFGGAERVLLELTKMFGEAPIYTLLYDKEKMGEWFPGERVCTSFLQKFPKFWRRRHKYLLPFLPVAPETFDLREFDLIISSSSAFAKGIVTRPKTIHINYCHNPSRFLWDYSYEYLGQQNLGNWCRISVKILMNYLRLWDRAASKRVDYFIANSCATAARIKKYYRRQAKVIYPPVEINILDVARSQDYNFQDVRRPKTQKDERLAGYERRPARAPTYRRGEQGWSACPPEPAAQAAGRRGWSRANSPPAAPENYFLIVSQLTPYKKIDIAIEAFNKLELPLIIIGEGPQKDYLQKIAKSNIKFLGWVPDYSIGNYYQGCLAFIFPGEDDFGIAPVEAMKYGKPVLALNRGGALETVLPGITGEFFEVPEPEVLADGVRRLRESYQNYSPMVIRKWAEKFSAEKFRKEIVEFIEKIRYN